MSVEGNSPRKQRQAHFHVQDWREIFDLYPSQWLAIAVEESTPQHGTTKGYIIARGKNDRTVFDSLTDFSRQHPEQEVAFFYTGRIVKLGQDVL